MKILIIINDAPYSTEKAHNVLRMAMMLQKEHAETTEVRTFLMADAVTCALPNQSTPQGYYNIERMMRSVFSKGGQVKACGIKGLGLIEGIATFVLAEAGSIPMATLFNAKDLTIARIVPWIPWILIIVLSNGFLEEVMFRGLFLRKLEPFWGKFMANLLIAFLFTALHGTVTYTAANLIFVAVLFPLALLWGYVMQKTDSIWGSVLFRAGMDIPIFLGIFSNM